MPKRKYTGLAPPRRKRKKTKVKSIVSVPRGIGIGSTVLRRSVNAKLTYHELHTFTGTLLAGTEGNYQYRMNGLWDPRVATLGGQPRGRDQMALMFQEYVVTKCVAEVWFQAGAGAGPLLPYLQIRETNGLTLDNKAVFEGSDRVIARQTLRGGTSAGNGNDSTKLVIECDILKWLGNKGKDNSRAGALVTADPTDQVILYAGLMNTSNGSITADIDMNVVLHYHVKFFNPRDPGAS